MTYFIPRGFKCPLGGLWSHFRKIKMDCNEKQQPLSLLVVKPSGESKTFALKVISSEVYHGQQWKPCPSLEIGFQTATEIAAFTGDDSTTPGFIQELIPYAYIEGSVVEDQVMGVTDDTVLWSWQVRLMGKPTTYEAANQAAQAYLDASWRSAKEVA